MTVGVLTLPWWWRSLPDLRRFKLRQRQGHDGGVVLEEYRLTRTPGSGVALTGFYGSGWMTGLGNTQVGGPNGTPDRVVSYRFKAAGSSLTAVKWQFPNFNTGYAGGTGGSLHISVWPDDGTATHAPDMSGTELAGYDITNLTGTTNNPPGGDNYPRIVFATPAALTTGNLYHLCFQNTDADPASNFVSVDDMYFDKLLSPRQAKFPDLEWAILYQDGTGTAWNERGVSPQTEQYTPIFQHEYGDGTIRGMAYLFSDVGAPKNINGTLRARQTMTPSADRDVVSVTIIGQRTAGTGDLTILLEENSGTVIDTGTIVNASLPTSWNKATRTFGATRRLTAGTAYNLVISTTAGTTWQMYAPYSGAYAGNWNPATFFPDGKAQYDAGLGAGWIDWEAPVRDLGFAFA